LQGPGDLLQKLLPLLLLLLLLLLPRARVLVLLEACCKLLGVQEGFQQLL
jgi:hypothetical protein